MEQKKILLIGTGGTIASEMGESGLAPELTSEQLLRYIPDISGICQVECLQLFSLDSTNIQPKHWARIASAIRAHYREFDGFVISHGTDTMAYTAAGLSYLVQGSPKPIVLTGAQKPIGFETTDSKQNKIIMGTRARKTRSKSFEAFSSINYPLLGMVRDGRIIRYIHPESRAVPQFYDDVNPRVALLKLIPGTDCGVAEFLLERNDALIIENEGSDLAVYHVGAGIKRNLPILEAYDMTSEAVTAKLMWILGQTTDRAWVQELFYTPVACDILAGK